MCTVLLPLGGYPIAINKYIISFISLKSVSALSLYLHIIFSCGLLLRFSAEVLFSFLVGFEVLMDGVLFLQSSEMCHIFCYLSTKLHGAILQKTVILTLISYFL